VRRRQDQRYGTEELPLRPEHVVPIVVRGTEALDGGVERDHSLCYSVTNGIGIKAAEDLAVLVEQGL
jgi:hypothetical protein